jgi:hypothetical protein
MFPESIDFAILQSDIISIRGMATVMKLIGCTVFAEKKFVGKQDPAYNILYSDNYVHKYNILLLNTSVIPVAYLFSSILRSFDSNYTKLRKMFP